MVWLGGYRVVGGLTGGIYEHILLLFVLWLEIVEMQQ
jgi:hypothetical protein